MKTSGSKQRYNFERTDMVFSNGGYQVLNTSGFASVCRPKEKINADLIMAQLYFQRGKTESKIQADMSNVLLIWPTSISRYVKAGIIDTTWFTKCLW